MGNPAFVHVGDTLTTVVNGKPISVKILDVSFGTSETWGVLIKIQHSSSKEPSSIGLSNFYEWMKQAEWTLAPAARPARPKAKAKE